jgi:large subunit ribosomal protein L24
MEAVMNIRKDDMVEVITGNDKGKVAKVLRVMPGANKVVVEGVRQVYRHTKPSRRNQQGGDAGENPEVHFFSFRAAFASLLAR